MPNLVPELLQSNCNAQYLFFNYYG